MEKETRQSIVLAEIFIVHSYIFS